jgi:hypothetical protein
MRSKTTIDAFRSSLMLAGVTVGSVTLLLALTRLLTRG